MGGTGIEHGAEPGRDDDAAMLRVLGRAQQLGFLGPSPVARHLAHARGFLAAWEAAGKPGQREGRGPRDALDLGAGGGLPGLVLAYDERTCTSRRSWALLDAHGRRTAFLRWAVRVLGLAGSVEVLTGRAEELAHEARWRGGAGLVTARAFGQPAVTAECALGFLEVGGALVVSEPPGPGVGAPRWPSAALAALGLRGQPVTVGAGRFEVLVLERPAPAHLPRRVGVPGKRPLFG